MFKITATRTMLSDVFLVFVATVKIYLPASAEIKKVNDALWR